MSTPVLLTIDVLAFCGAMAYGFIGSARDRPADRIRLRDTRDREDLRAWWGTLR